MKRCSRCGFLKPPCEFSARADTPDGKQYTCRPCATEARAVWRAENRKHTNMVSLLYYYRTKNKKKREAQG
jgi:hypothetical protein